ncbi:MAG: type II toxin-antitoxin system RelE/ParE family toxin [Gemmataceae bacterium]
MKPRWSESARRHLREVHDYIARDSKINAKRLVARIKKAVERLGKSPEAGWVVEDFDNPLLREIVVGSYRILYAVMGKVARILAVHHGARRLPRMEQLLDDD